MPFRKRTAIMTNEKALLSLAMSCEGGHTHQHLKGSDKVEIGGKLVYRNLTRLAGAYPSRLCRRWAQMVREIGPSNRKCKVTDVEIHEFDKLLKEARRTTDRETSQAADAPDHPNWEGEANCDARVLQEARDFIHKHAVIFGQFKRSDIDAEYTKKPIHGQTEE